MSAQESNNYYDLADFETIWVTHQPFLLHRGYRLRPRYEPGWVGSWVECGKDPSMCEDSIANFPWNVIDAIRVADNLKVSLKLVPTYTEQVPIALYLCSEPLLSDRRNRCVRILDYIPLPADDDWGLLVMPFLREFDDPPFEFKGECVEVIGQMIECLEFMHEHNVAHRDACNGNIMMDSNRIIPSGFHHAERATHDGIRRAGHSLTWTSRLYVQSVDYYFIDFGLSTRFESAANRTFVTGKFGQDKTVPELSETISYDPFKVDIYQLGGVVKELLETYDGLDFLRPLADVMTRTDPSKRPTASEAFRLFREIESRLDLRALKGRIMPHKDTIPWLFLQSVDLRTHK